MKKWTDKAWENDLPRLNRLAMESVDGALSSFGFIANNCNEIIEWIRPFWTGGLPDDSWIVRFSNRDGIRCDLFPDGVRVSCFLITATSNSQQFMNAATALLQVKTFFESLKADEAETDKPSVFCWQMEVTYEALADTVSKIVNCLQSANMPFEDAAG